MKGSEINPAGSQRTQPAYLPLLFAMAGFVLAQPVYNLILSAPEFLVARQNTQTDLWSLVIVLHAVVPTLLGFVGIVLLKIHRPTGRIYYLIVTFVFTGLFFAQLSHDILAPWLPAFFAVVLCLAILFTRVLLHPNWRKLTWALAVLSVSFPVLFMLQVPELDYGEGVTLPGTDLNIPDSELPPIVMIIADELPLSTLIDGDAEIDQELFPNIYRLQHSSNWYRNAISIADGTPEAVPAILTGKYPSTENTPATIANAPVNLFTILQSGYNLNVSESVTRLCPRTFCPVYSPPGWNRFSALLLDLSALYLHRVLPQQYNYVLPDVSNSFSGFFAEKQQFFPGGWLEFTQGQATANRPEMFRQFLNSIEQQERPTLHFLHFLYPHVPFAYLPDGRNYGDHWLRGLEKEEWHDSAWGVLNSKQRYFLQVQHFDKLIGDLLDHLESLRIFDKSLVVLVADHGVAFRAKDRRRALSELNIAEILRVPLLIKWPRQTTAQIFDAPVMTIDILPTVLGILNYQTPESEFDGIDLGRQLPAPGRDRQALSFKHREYRSFDEAQLAIGSIVELNRSELALDDPDRVLWAIGPFADYRGLPLDSLCKPGPSGIRSVSGQNKPLPGAEDDVIVPAFVTGRFDGDLADDQNYPFVITVDDIIVASGETWQLRGNQLYFAMVEPKYITETDWSPKAWLYTPAACLGYPADG